MGQCVSLISSKPCMFASEGGVGERRRRVKGSRIRFEGVGFRVQGTRFRVQGFGASRCPCPTRCYSSYRSGAGTSSKPAPPPPHVPLVAPGSSVGTVRVIKVIRDILARTTRAKKPSPPPPHVAPGSSAGTVQNRL